MPKVNCFYPFNQFISYNSFLISVFFVFIFFSILYIINVKKSALNIIAFASILLGGAKNYSDRLKHACVADPISLFGLFYFNFYDVIIFIGVVILLVNIASDKYKILQRR